LPSATKPNERTTFSLAIWMARDALAKRYLGQYIETSRLRASRVQRLPDEPRLLSWNSFIYVLMAEGPANRGSKSHHHLPPVGQPCGRNQNFSGHRRRAVPSTNNPRRRSWATPTSPPSTKIQASEHRGIAHGQRSAIMRRDVAVTEEIEPSLTQLRTQICRVRT